MPDHRDADDDERRRRPGGDAQRHPAPVARRENDDGDHAGHRTEHAAAALRHPDTKSENYDSERERAPRPRGRVLHQRQRGRQRYPAHNAGEQRVAHTAAGIVRARTGLVAEVEGVVAQALDQRVNSHDRRGTDHGDEQHRSIDVAERDGGDERQRGEQRDGHEAAVAGVGADERQDPRVRRRCREADRAHEYEQRNDCWQPRQRLPRFGLPQHQARGRNENAQRQHDRLRQAEHVGAARIERHGDAGERRHDRPTRGRTPLLARHSPSMTEAAPLRWQATRA